jgi:HSP20 family protein
MAIVRWEPARELATLQSEMSRLMNQFWGAPDAGGGRNGSAWLPALDVWETDDEIVLAVDLPGIEEKDISVEVDDGVLTVSGERSRETEEKNDRYYRFERRFGQFSRSVTLPQGIDPSTIKAEFTNGVLEVHVPKPEERKPTRIQIGERGTVDAK